MTQLNQLKDVAAKTLFIICLLIMGLVVKSNAQTITKLPDGNYLAIKAAPKDTAATYSATGKTFTTSRGETFPVMVSSKGKLFVIRTSKAGSQYRQYISKGEKKDYQFNVDQTGYDIYSDGKLIGRIKYGENPSLDKLIDKDNQ
jgi:hypothetical protein